MFKTNNSSIYRYLMRQKIKDHTLITNKVIFIAIYLSPTDENRHGTLRARSLFHPDAMA
jgi:hypothetical protein